MVELWVEIAALCTLIGLSSFFSGLEVALVGTRISKINQLRKKKVRGSEALYRLKSNPGWMMSSVNLGNNLVNVGASALATSVALRLFGNDGLAIAVGIMTFLILIFGEITPKTYCNANATKVSLRFAGVLLVFSYALWPIVKMFEQITRVIVKLTGSSYTAPPITKDDIQGIVEQGLQDRVLEKDETKMVRGALRFDDITIRHTMTPRSKIVALPEKTLLVDSLPQLNQASHSRIPIFNTGVDDITGYVHVKDVLKQVEGSIKPVTLRDISRKPLFVTSGKTINSLLKDMKAVKTHIAIVVNEHGSVEGIVTLEDLIETIVGDIEDETDLSQTDYKKTDHGALIADGDMRVTKVNDILGSSIPQRAAYFTINGLLHDQLRNIPQKGDIVTVGGIKIEVKEVSNNRAVKVSIQRIH